MGLWASPLMDPSGGLWFHHTGCSGRDMEVSYGLAHSDVTAPFRSASPLQSLCSAPVPSLHTYIPAFLFTILPHQPFSSVFSSRSHIHIHTPCLPFTFPLQLSTPPSSYLWPMALRTLSSALLIPIKPSHFCSFSSFLLFSSGSESCSLSLVVITVAFIRMAAFPLPYCVGTSRRDTKFLPCWHLKKKKLPATYSGFLFFPEAILKYLAFDQWEFCVTGFPVLGVVLFPLAGVEAPLLPALSKGCLRKNSFLDEEGWLY